MNKLAHCLLWGLMLMCPYLIWAQVDNTENIGFEKGSLAGWTLTEGTVTRSTSGSVFSPEIAAINTSFFQLTSLSDGKDDKITSEQIPKTFNQSKNAIRLGNTLKGGTYQKIKTSFLVTAAHSLFQYHFAILLQNSSSHPNSEKPSFKINIKNAAGNPVTCGDFNVQLETNLVSGFKKQGDIEYKNWTTGAIDLRQYIGQNLNIEVLVQGCAGLQHFGYAYFDAELLKTEIKTASNCPAPDGSMIFLAPEGFEKYTWDNGNTQRGATYKPSLNQIINVTLIPFSSLNAACAITLPYKVPYKNVSTQTTSNICEGEKFMIDKTPYTSTGVFSQTINRFGICDSTVVLNQLVTPLARQSLNTNLCNSETLKIRDTTINTTGLYKVRIKRLNKCDSIVTANVNHEKFKLQTIPNHKLVEDEELILEANTAEGTLGDFTWKWGQDSCRNCSRKSLYPTLSSTYFLDAKSQSGHCSQRTSFKLSILPCSFFIPSAFSPNNDQINDDLKIEGGNCIQEVSKLVVYDRWGDQLHLKSNFKLNETGHFWTGLNGNTLKMVQTGMYYYSVSGITKKGKPLLKTGSVMVLK